MTHFAFYPTSDWWFWVENEPPWSLETPPDPAVRAAFSKTVVWEEDRDFARIGVCADGLIFASFEKEDESDLAANLYHLNALNLLFVSALRREARIDAGLEWISRTSRICGYQTEKGFGGSGNTLSRNWAGLMSRRWSGDLPPEWFMMRKQIGLGVIESWAATVGQTFHSTVRVRLLAEYALALGLFHDHNFSGALTHSWFVSEHLFSAKWQGLFPTKAPHTAAGEKINDLKEHIDLSLHSDLESTKDIRNDLAHAVGDADPVAEQDANLSFLVADRLIELEWGLSLSLGGRGLTF